MHADPLSGPSPRLGPQMVLNSVIFPPVHAKNETAACFSLFLAQYSSGREILAICYGTGAWHGDFYPRILVLGIGIFQAAVSFLAWLAIVVFHCAAHLGSATERSSPLTPTSGAAIASACASASSLSYTPHTTPCHSTHVTPCRSTHFYTRHLSHRALLHSSMFPGSGGHVLGFMREAARGSPLTLPVK